MLINALWVWTLPAIIPLDHRDISPLLASPERSAELPTFWQQSPYQPSVHCDNERRLGGDPNNSMDGGKWVCEPEELAKEGKSCLVYSFGSENEWTFEQAILDIAPECEIHTFDPFVSAPAAPPGVTFHAYGVGHPLLTAPANDPGLTLQPPSPEFIGLPAIVLALGHEQRVISLLKVDIEGGEFDALGGSGIGRWPVVREVEVEVHLMDRWGERDADRLVRAIEGQGYELFHKEENVLASCCCELAFRRLTG
ncbi:unnamed protein product [Vitrella brassicaformis CCMP3155]|uniref:Methyltransferase domain-containing protein n=1 Tax=Vitrella brassicaformis (strain CCMP3155) TaxID=1169540 RepID=A0A0G4GXQ3_VITBC|nr:unnamed protein product [Vitrella brassicaformis CCMP3155]|eukprot:CEM35757.1 unnamed protein product [Vitrella brassicaformis CCMP3155]